MICSSTFLKYHSAVLAQTPAAYILMYCNSFSATFTAFRCFQLVSELRENVQHTFVYDYRMSESSSSAKNSHLSQGGRRTMMPMPVNRITSQCKIKLSQKYCPWINSQLWNFCHSFLQLMGSFFLIIVFCPAIHVYTDRFAGMGIMVISPPCLRREFLAELPVVLTFWS